MLSSTEHCGSVQRSGTRIRSARCGTRSAEASSVNGSRLQRERARGRRFECAQDVEQRALPLPEGPMIAAASPASETTRRRARSTDPRRRVLLGDVVCLDMFQCRDNGECGSTGTEDETRSNEVTKQRRRSAVTGGRQRRRSHGRRKHKPQCFGFVTSRFVVITGRRAHVACAPFCSFLRCSC